MAVDYVDTFFDAEFGVEFEFSQEDSVYSYFIFEGQHETVAVGVDAAAEYRFFLLKFQS